MECQVADIAPFYSFFLLDLEMEAKVFPCFIYKLRSEHYFEEAQHLDREIQSLLSRHQYTQMTGLHDDLILGFALDDRHQHHQ